ncbi:NUDIX hydrolase [Epilithonimonas xixisoli]|uniref:ADP-ribose pyrophosphatase YjhB (NUDIX family) n=1 Tax=Epilithonimonas xixisoli TaxID=1476462 RepID=A0A4R8I7Z5_9FLAO|nr:NUDIX domain-containing protein [Epilithonimonas xixisoli]TDX86128.1 ADP-ribose pyrophosphatase YjhB (NUDIX family) [Epilithonimonas xixisoli]
MYKVFINEKKIVLSQEPQDSPKTLNYDGTHSFEFAVDLLTNTASQGLNIYHNDIEQLWADFKSFFRNIEAAGGIVLNPENKILFIHRLGKWDLPKGKIEKGESKELAAVREVEEECGIFDLELKDFINSTYHIYTERNGDKVLKTTYWFEMFYNGTGTPKPQIEEGITEVGWKNEEEIESEILPSTFQNIKLILNDFKSKNPQS